MKGQLIHKVFSLFERLLEARCVAQVNSVLVPVLIPEMRPFPWLSTSHCKLCFRVETEMTEQSRTLGRWSIQSPTFPQGKKKNPNIFFFVKVIIDWLKAKLGTNHMGMSVIRLD